MKNIIIFMLVGAGLIFGQRFGVSMGTGTYAGYDDYSPKHITGDYYMSLNEKFTLGFSLGMGNTSFNTETDFDDPNQDDTKNSVKISGIPLEVEFMYSHQIANSSVKPFVGLGMGIYSYTRVEEDDNYDSDATTMGLGQFVTFGLDMTVSEKITMFVQFKKLGFAFMTTKEDYDHDNNNRDAETITDYLAKPGTNDLGISAGIKFNF